MALFSTSDSAAYQGRGNRGRMAFAKCPETSAAVLPEKRYQQTASDASGPVNAIEHLNDDKRGSPYPGASVLCHGIE